MSCLHRHGPGPAVALIPGSYSAASQWDDVVARLDPDWTVTLIELRGHGDSWPPPSNGSIEQFAVDCVSVLDTLDIDRLYIGGHSIGGMVALEVARTHGTRVKGVLCCEGWTNHHAQEDAFGGATKNVLSPEQTAKAGSARTTVTQRWTDGQVKAFGKIWRCWDGYDFLCNTDIPILELYGDRGRPPASLEALHIPDRPNILLRWIEGASHSHLPLARPDEVAAEFTRFVRAVERGEAPSR